MKKIHKKLVALLAGVICLAGFGTTWAHYTNVITIKNPFSTSKSSAVLVENFHPDSTFLPGETVDKQPYFENTGDMDLVLRVKVTEGWKDAAGKPLAINPAPSVDAVEKLWTDSWSGDWVKGSGNTDYYYYKHILNRSGDSNGKDKTPIILQGLKLSNEISNDTHDIDYSNLTYYLNFEAEAVPNDKVSVSEWKTDIGASAAHLDWGELVK